ncbi:Gfo/Idh/MocA family protein [Vibrio sp. TBV020]|uniref:Gfo/Idh/MocA family protein n=1 Tax=Vibrio sp. TBV020 TaxID=3137398 RepID=UPI0038CD72D4
MKWGILGTSFISDVMAQAINNDSNSQLHAVAGRNPTMLEEFKKKHGPSRSYLSMDELIADSDVEVVYIALPNHLHHEYVVKAAQAGKAILCEKSLSVDMEKSDIALNAVDKHNVFFAEGLMYLNHPIAAQILELLESGTIGDVRSIQGSYVAAISQFVNPDSKGTLYNLGCYPVSLMHLVLQHQFGDEVFADTEISAIGRRGADGNICETSALFKFNGQLTAQIHTAEDYGLKHQFTILGSKGSISFVTNPWLPAEDNKLVIEVYETSTEEVVVPAQGDGFFYQVRNVRQAIESGAKQLERPSATPKDSWQIMKLLTDWEKAAS